MVGCCYCKGLELSAFDRVIVCVFKPNEGTVDNRRGPFVEKLRGSSGTFGQSGGLVVVGGGAMKFVFVCL